ncbi:sigma-70 family RNA polymerase sigma factor [Streptomyces zaomyceticus]|uniref:sigma-70 family RNA polymerase sigma factor n=1 Tax=Streptomyces zaomyceticus TaxID=68286 RepID=UPI00369556AF
MRQTVEPGTSMPGLSATLPRPDGHREFLSDVYRHHARPLLRYATRLLHGDSHKAEDLLQEAATRAWKHFAATGGDPVSIRPWLFTVTRNLAIDHHRAQATRPPESPVVESLGLALDDPAERVLVKQVVLDALKRLPLGQREVIVLTFYRGYSVAQVSDALGIPSGTVKSRAYYGLRALHDILSANGVVEP